MSTISSGTTKRPKRDLCCEERQHLSRSEIKILAQTKLAGELFSGIAVVAPFMCEGFEKSPRDGAQVFRSREIVTSKATSPEIWADRQAYNRSPRERAGRR